MIYPEKSANETKRLDALAGYDILGTLPEKEYDDIAKLASIICDTSISLITFISEENEFRKSALGLPRTVSSRDQTFCAHAILTPLKFTVVPDARMDKRFEDNPLVIGNPGIIFYAGMPLVTSDGFALGMLCVIDHQPRHLSERQIEAMQSLSSQVVKLLELRKSVQLLKASQKKLEDYADQMKAFVHLASHDLKEPARMVNKFMIKLENDYASQLDEKAKRYIYFAADGAKRMTALIDDLLAYYTTEGLSEVKEHVDLESLLTEIVGLQSGVISEKDAIVIWEMLPVIIAPAMGMKLIFQNLISNALKYHAKDSQPKITVSFNQADSHWEFEVKDNGIGIEVQYQEDVFLLFKRLHSKNEYSGTGMGLATCKKIVGLLGGSIGVRANEEGGSIFIFTIEKC
jgi:signal transduction histidine kinase